MTGPRVEIDIQEPVHAAASKKQKLISIKKELRTVFCFDPETTILDFLKCNRIAFALDGKGTYPFTLQRIKQRQCFPNVASRNFYQYNSSRIFLDMYSFSR